MDSHHHGLHSTSANVFKKIGLFTVLDRLSEMTRFTLFGPSLDAPKAASIFKNHVYRRHILLKNIESKSSCTFLSNFWKSLFSGFGTKLAPSSAYHPQTNGQSEVMNRKVEEVTRSSVSFDRSSWDEYLAYSRITYSSLVNTTTSFTPLYLSYEVDPVPISTDLLSSLNPGACDFWRSIQRATEEVQKAIKGSSESTAE